LRLDLLDDAHVLLVLGLAIAAEFRLALLHLLPQLGEHQYDLISSATERLLDVRDAQQLGLLLGQPVLE